MKTPKNSLFLLLFNETPKESTQFHNLKKDFIEMNEWKCISQSTQTVKKKNPHVHMYRWDNNNDRNKILNIHSLCSKSTSCDKALCNKIGYSKFMDSWKNTTIQDADTHNQEGWSVLGSGGTDLGYCSIHWYQPTYKHKNQMKSHKTSSNLERTEFFPNENFRLIILYCQDLW